MQKFSIEEAVALVQDVLGGHYNKMCYVASEAVYWLVGGKSAGLTPMQMRVGEESHWFLRGPDNEIIDITASQYNRRIFYEKARGRGFLTKYPSKRAYALIDMVYSRLSHSREAT